jgi:hypothetical protein
MLLSNSPRRFYALLTTLLVAAVLGPTAPMQAHVTKIVIDAVESPTASGQSFGTAGQYEKLSGRIFGEIDPKDRRNALIQDIALAPKNANGMVEYVATFALVKPIDMSKSSGILWYSVVNRGTGVPAPTPYGHVVLVSGWQGDVIPTAINQTIQVPVAKNADGSSITGRVIYRFWNEPAGTTTINLKVPQPGAYTGNQYQTATLDTTRATLTPHTCETHTEVCGTLPPLPSTDWAWADCTTKPFPGSPDPTKLCLKNGTDPNLLYQLIYEAKDPLVLGVGLAAVRDVVSFFRYEAKDSVDTSNPVAGRISHTISQGVSQSGNLLKTMVHLGFNEDEMGRIVFEGINPHIAARQTPMNFRFAFPGGAATLFEPGSEPLLWWSNYHDQVRGRAAGSLLDRCRATNTCPKIIETFGPTEFWNLRMSPGLVGTRGDHDLPLPSNVFRYYLPGTTHAGGPGGFNTTLPPGTVCLFPNNPNPQTFTMNALMVALTHWVVKGTLPPPSRYPTLKNGLLVPATKARVGFPTLPGVTPTLPDGIVNTMLDYDFGPQFRYSDMSGIISLAPPTIKQPLAMLVPRVNPGDGNEIGGVPSVLHQAPLATYLGWNVFAGGFFKGQQCAFAGGAIPFAKFKADRLASNDPRPSLEERYGTQEGYVCRVKAAAAQAVRDRFLLAADADTLIAQATAASILPAASVSSAEDNRIGQAICNRATPSSRRKVRKN